ncbi:Flp pilus assembly complex ATPase component TadA [Patescibacteria group bacterium]|nr:Flp pilus assembly complex ATPase component TadA [Patescibacteria group bacterium]
MFDPVQSNDPLQVPQTEPVSLGDSPQVGDVPQSGSVSQASEPSLNSAMNPVSNPNQTIMDESVATPDDIEKIASSLEVDVKNIAANSTSDSADETEVIPQKTTSSATSSTTSPVTSSVVAPNLGEQPLSEGIDPNKTYINIVDVLKDQGALSQDEASQIMVTNVSTGKSFSEILEENKFVKEEDLVKAKSVVYKIPFIKISESGTDPQALSQIPEGVARNYQMMPILFDKDKNTLLVAMKNPLDLSAIDFAEQKSGLKLITRYAMPSELERKIAESYSQSLSGEVTEALEQTSQVEEDMVKRKDLKVLSGETIRQAPITKIVQTIVSFAMKARASDVHIEPQESRTRVRYRIDGILVEKLILPQSVHEAVVSRIKILSGLKIDEKRIPQDGRFNFISGDKEVDLRVSTLPTVNGEKIVMRLLKKDATVPDMEELGLTGMALRQVKDLIKVPHGIILVTGPTGSGKTTTLYSILHTINTSKVNIITLEDPVEYQMTSVNQVQVNQQAGLTFASGLRSFLRQDPNIIMVGEIRDSETADLAVQASLTGHLVFSTLHTSSAAGAIPRLMDMGVEPFLLTSSLTLAMAQRVVRVINKKFKEEYKPEKAVVDDIREVLGPRLDEWLRKNNRKDEDIILYRAKEDRPQTEPEYKGRIAIFEVMPISEGITRLILEKKPAIEMEKLAVKDGMLLMKQDGYLKALEGITTIEEVLRVAQI